MFCLLKRAPSRSQVSSISLCNDFSVSGSEKEEDREEILSDSLNVIKGYKGVLRAALFTVISGDVHVSLLFLFKRSWLEVVQMILSLCLFYLKEMSSTWWKATAADYCDATVLRGKILWICPSSWTFKNLLHSAALLEVLWLSKRRVGGRAFSYRAPLLFKSIFTNILLNMCKEECVISTHSSLIEHEVRSWLR